MYKTGLEALTYAEGLGGIVLKPRANQDDIKKRIKAATLKKVSLIGVDVDAASFTTMKLLKRTKLK